MSANPLSDPINIRNRNRSKLVKRLIIIIIQFNTIHTINTKYMFAYLFVIMLSFLDSLFGFFLVFVLIFLLYLLFLLFTLFLLNFSNPQVVEKVLNVNYKWKDSEKHFLPGHYGWCCTGLNKPPHSKVALASQSVFQVKTW